ncbi:MAG: hypothetical protein OEV85_03170 [Candidatus Thorarchaeota archaeon]|nr:hypothetical protein [Candidatus Thorarchaeota archaeon]
MRNFAGGFIGIIVGSFSLVILAGILPSQPSYPDPFNAIWFLLAGSWVFQSTLQELVNMTLAGPLLLSWLIIGIVIAPFSRKGWNLLRSTLWVAVFLTIFALIFQVLENPSFWDVNLNPTRNYDLIFQFATSIVVSLFALPSAIPITITIERARQTGEQPIPEKIETICECGAIFKSNPIICSECGRILRMLEN